MIGVGTVQRAAHSGTPCSSSSSSAPRGGQRASPPKSGRPSTHARHRRRHCHRRQRQRLSELRAASAQKKLASGKHATADLGPLFRCALCGDARAEHFEIRGGACSGCRFCSCSRASWHIGMGLSLVIALPPSCAYGASTWFCSLPGVLGSKATAMCAGSGRWCSRIRIRRAPAAGMARFVRLLDH
jgi:hypothetical protein